MPDRNSPVVDPSDTIHPRVTLARISTNFSGDPLDKTVGNWKTWSSKIHDNLAICGLGNHIKEIKAGSTIILDANVQPIAHDNWNTNDGMAQAYIRLNCATVESELLDDVMTTYECFKTLEKYHPNEGPVKQVNLIQNALAQRVARDKDQVSNCRKIRENIRRAFRMPGGITEEAFINITLLIVLGCGHEHMRAMIQHDMQAATDTTPFLSEQVMLYLEQDLQLLLGDEQCSGTADTIALMAQSSQKRGGARSPLECSNCKRTGHTADFCVHAGGGMAGKSIEDAQAARRKELRNRQEKPKDSKDSKPKVALSFKDSNGRAFITHVNTDNITAMNSTPVTSSTIHANLASIDLDSPSLNLPIHLTGIETVEYEGFLACLDDPVVSIDWNQYSNDVEVSPTMIAAPHQNRRTAVISLNACPLFRHEHSHIPRAVRFSLPLPDLLKGHKRRWGVIHYGDWDW